MWCIKNDDNTNIYNNSNDNNNINDNNNNNNNNKNDKNNIYNNNKNHNNLEIVSPFSSSNPNFPDTKELKLCMLLAV